MEEANETRRPRGFRRDHPVFFWGVVALVALFLGGAAVVAWRVPRYRAETAQLEARMSETERRTQQELLRMQEERGALAFEMLRRDVRMKALQSEKVHLALSVEDSVLELRHGPATLRRIRVAVGGDSTVRAPDGRTWRFVRPVGERHVAEKAYQEDYVVPEWVYVSRGEPVPPEEERTVARGLGTYVLRLDDGTEIYSEPPEGPLEETVKPASFMTGPNDLGAIFAAVREDTPVFIY